MSDDYIILTEDSDIIRVKDAGGNDTYLKKSLIHAVTVDHKTGALSILYSNSTLSNIRARLIDIISAMMQEG